jgi:hypothetical protein
MHAGEDRPSAVADAYRAPVKSVRPPLLIHVSKSEPVFASTTSEHRKLHRPRGARACPVARPQADTSLWVTSKEAAIGPTLRRLHELLRCARSRIRKFAKTLD